MRAGDVSCPAELPQKTLVGTGVTIACSACPCTATNAACTGVATYYGDSGCATKVATVTTACGPSGAENNTQANAYKWAGTTTATCTIGASSATASLSEVSTICCR
jgi:hypothetical protein